MFKLQWPDFPSPHWFARGLGGNHYGVMLADDTVKAEGNILKIKPDEHNGMIPCAGTELVILKERLYLIAEEKNLFEQQQLERQKLLQAQAQVMQEQYQKERHDRLVILEKKAHDNNSLLQIPVRWTSGFKPVLSGLSRNSSGTGENARSVTHILLLQDIDEGGFHRKANGFLCTTAKGSNGQMWTGHHDTYSSGINGHYVSEITCKQCLKIAKRWQGKMTGIKPELIKK
jgi:hypothetical protein